MNLDELEAFVAAVETGSIVAAARSTDTARATLRRRLDALEARAGVRLLHRTPRGVAPTEAGAVLAARGRRILEDANALLSSVREVAAEPAGELCFALPVGLPPQVITPLLVALRERYPALSLRVQFSDDPLRSIREGADVVAHFGDPGPRGAWAPYEMMSIRERLVASPDYLSRRGKPASRHELSGHDLLAWKAPDTDPCLWPVLDGTTVRVEPGVISTDIHMLRGCAAAGLGIAFLPETDLPMAGVASEELVPVLPGEIGRERRLRVLVPALLSDIPRIRAVLTGIRDVLGLPALAGIGADVETRPDPAS